MKKLFHLLLVTLFFCVSLSSQDRFTRINDLLIDNELQHTWQDDIFAKTTKLDLTKAISYCKNLKLNNFNNWRLPTYEELLSIGNYDIYKPIINKAFQNHASGHYWSIIYKKTLTGDSLSFIDSIDVRRIYFSDGFSYDNDRTGKAFVRCIK